MLFADDGSFHSFDFVLASIQPVKGVLLLPDLILQVLRGNS